MPDQYSPQWQTVLDNTNISIEVMASLTEDAVNHFLERHYAIDNQRYAVSIERTVPDGTTNRTFKVQVSAGAPLRAELPPFNPPAASDAAAVKRMRLFRDPAGWDELRPPIPHPQLYVPQVDDPEDPESSRGKPNLRLWCDELSFTLTWPRLDGGRPDWSYTFKVNLLAEAWVNLQAQQSLFFLRVIPIRFKFDKPVDTLARSAAKAAAKSLASTKPDAKGQLLVECEQKFYDLIVIAMNVLGNQVAPQLVQNIQLPVPNVANKPLQPVLLDMSGKIVTVGCSLDRQAVAASAAEKVTKTLAAYNHLLEQDIADAGGLHNILCEPSKTGNPAIGGYVVRKPAQIERLLPRTTAFLRAQEQDLIAAEKKVRATDTEVKRVRAAVPDGAAIAVNEYFLNIVASSLMPAPKGDCTDWLSLGAVRGRACYWLRLYSPSIAINGTTVSGQIGVDVGGALEGCVRKFWDCSWRWACDELSLALNGTPGIALTLLRGRNIVLSPRIIGKVQLETNLPFPFDKIVEAISGLVWQGAKLILNILLGFLTVEIVPPVISFPEQKTKLKLSDFTPFSFQRQKPARLDGARKRFIAFRAGLTASR